MTRNPRKPSQVRTPYCHIVPVSRAYPPSFSSAQNINTFVVAQGTTLFVPETNPPRFVLILQWKPSLSKGQTAGQTVVEGRQKKLMCSCARNPPERSFAKCLQEMGEKCGEISAVFLQFFVTQLPGKWPQKKNHDKSSTFSTVHQIEFLHCCNSGGWGAQCVQSLCAFFVQNQKHTTFQGNPKGGLAKGGLARKAPIGPKRALSGQFLLFPRGCGVRRNWSRSAPKRPRQALKRLQSAPKRPDFPGRISPRFSLKIWGLSPRL